MHGEILSQLQVGQLPVMNVEYPAKLCLESSWQLWMRIIPIRMWSEIGFGGLPIPAAMCGSNWGADPWEPPLADLAEEGGDSSDAPL